jgi:archaellum component FlaF (FlaF/FlaG flagellin family)
MRINRRKLRRNLGVSTVVANMLMILITLSLAAILVAWAGTTYGAFSGGSSLFFQQRGQALQERLVIENVYFNSSEGFIRVFVRNVGVIDISVVAIYVNGTTPGGASDEPPGTCTVPGSPVPMGVGQVCEFRPVWIFTGSYTPGSVFNIVVATARGNQATYIARGP